MLTSYTSKKSHCIQPDIHPAPQSAKLQSKDSSYHPSQQVEEVESAMSITLFLKYENKNINWNMKFPQTLSTNLKL